MHWYIWLTDSRVLSFIVRHTRVITCWFVRQSMRVIFFQNIWITYSMFCCCLRVCCIVLVTVLILPLIRYSTLYRVTKRCHKRRTTLCLVLNGVFKICAEGWMFVSVFQLLAFLHTCRVYARLKGKCQEMCTTMLVRCFVSLVNFSYTVCCT